MQVCVRQHEIAVHSNFALCKREKFTFLKTYLTGSEAKVVAGVTLTDSDYDAALYMLPNRFGRKNLIVKAHIL